jgi:hypothetical protein
MSFGFGFSLPGWQTLSGGFTPASLFTQGEQGAWYDPSDYSTLFQDSAGTTPVTAVEQSVGLMLDKRVPVAQTGYYSGVFDGNGDELSAGSNDAFAFGNGAYTVEFWTYLTAAVSGTHQPSFLCANATGGWIIYNNTTNLIVGVRGVSNDYLTTSLTAGVWNHVVAVRSGTGVNQFSIFVNGTRTLNTTDAKNWTVNGPLQIGGITLANYYVTGYMSNVRVVKGTAVYDPAQATLTVPTTPLTAISGTSLLTCQNSTFIDNSGNNFTITAVGDAKTGARNPFGNHAFQSTSTSRPVLRARYNLLTYSEQFNNAAWTKTAISAANTSATTDPIGGTTADTLVPTTANTAHFASVSVLSVGTNASATFSVYAKANGYNFVRVQLSTGSANPLVYFNVNTGVVGAIANNSGTVTATSITSVGNGWYRCTVTALPDSGVSFTSAIVLVTNADNTPSFAGDGTSGVYVWGAQVIATNSLLSNNYQRIAAATDYNASGFLPYLAFDGVDDSMLTNSVDFTATDKMTVWAGVRSLTGGTYGALVENSSNADANNGTFLMSGNGNLSTYRIAFSSRGTISSSAFENSSTYNPPVTVAQTGIGDISGDVSTLRVNGTQAATSATDQGTGNYGNYPLYIGRRNNASFPLNGNLFSLIIRGAQSSAAQISSTESWVNQRTGAY